MKMRSSAAAGVVVQALVGGCSEVGAHFETGISREKIKLASVATASFCHSQDNACWMPWLRERRACRSWPISPSGQLRNKIPQLELALEGKLQDHHRFLLQLQRSRLEAVVSDLALITY